MLNHNNPNKLTIEDVQEKLHCLFDRISERAIKERDAPNIEESVCWHLSRNTNKIAESAVNKDTVVDFFHKNKEKQFQISI